MPRLSAFIKKEFIQLLRDKHALALLFIMPSLFILIMSLAMQSGFEAHRSVQLDFYLIDNANSPMTDKLIARLDESGVYRRLDSTERPDEIRERVNRDEARFLLLLEEDFEKRLDEGKTAVRLFIGPATEASLAMLVESQLRGLVGEMYLERVLTPLSKIEGLDFSPIPAESKVNNLLTVESLYSAENTSRIPTSVQQNVPAWLLFAMFFVAIPLSTTLIAERQDGTLARLQTMGFPRSELFIAKLVPFLLVNIGQVILMLLVGVYIVPLLGGDRLTLGGSFGALSLISVSASLAAVSYGLLIAHLVRTTEQATILSGACNIIMAAIGGVMVPRFLMPQFMQELSWISPMTWGLEGYLDVFLRGGSVTDVLPQCAGLLVFAFLAMGFALLAAHRRASY
jgi:ABC-2 type transport system permease protein